jgi:hypothetical protein
MLAMLQQTHGDQMALSIEIILIWDSNLSHLNKDGATHV